MLVSVACDVNVEILVTHMIAVASIICSIRYQTVLDVTIILHPSLIMPLTYMLCLVALWHVIRNLLYIMYFLHVVTIFLPQMQPACHTALMLPGGDLQ